MVSSGCDTLALALRCGTNNLECAGVELVGATQNGDGIYVWEGSHLGGVICMGFKVRDQVTRKIKDLHI